MRVVRSLFVLLFVLQVVDFTLAIRSSPLQSIDNVPGNLESDLNEREEEAELVEDGDETDPVPPVPRVTVPDLGTAIGRTLTSFEEREFYGFMSIPYAEPPTGNMRFKYADLWTGQWAQETEAGEYEATFLRDRCIQKSMILNVTAGSEDCLHLSIYTPVFPEETPSKYLPVMVWFHGGAYLTGDANLYVPTKLMDRNVIVVVVQYRLGSMGFLAGGIPGAPGNMGLMDQVTSLRWVQKYIRYFGGDEGTVTVFGQSAGGASSSWMHVTPLTQGSNPNNNNASLLHRVIPQSGSALELWTIDPYPEEGFQLTADTLGCGDKTTAVAKVICMRGKSVDEVNRASLKIYANDRAQGGLGFKALCPVVQDTLAEKHPDIEVVIPKPPEEMLANGEFLKIPLMGGTVRDEGALVVGLAYEDFMYPNNHTIDDVDFMKYDCLPTLLNAFGLDDQNAAIANTMRVAYLPDAEMGNWTSMIGGLIDMSGVLFLKSGLWQVASYVNRVAPEINIYFYSWEYENDDSLFPWIFNSMIDIPVPGGISHGDELLYLFHLPSNLDAGQREMARKMITLWTNFAKYGNPTPNYIEDPTEEWEGMVNKWEKYTNDNYNFMLITDDFVMDHDFTSRWHHDRDIKQLKETANKQYITINESQELDMSAYVPLKDYEAEFGRANSNGVAVGVFEGFLVLAVVAGCIFAIFQRQAARGSGIV